MKYLLHSCLVFASLALPDSLFAQSTEIAQLVASDADSGDQFGHSVAVSGDSVVIGAPLDEAAGFYAGSAYVHIRDGADWVEQAKLYGSTVSTSDRFGWAVDISGDLLVVSAIFGDGVSPVSGTVYAFKRSGLVWNEIQVIAAPDGASSDWFGRSLALQGNTLVIGAPQDDDVGAESGSVYVYVFNGSIWQPQAKLLASDGAAGDNFGQSVALSNDSIVVGSPFDNVNGSTSGSAYVFTRSGAQWTQQAKLIPSDGSLFDSFGYAVDLSGDQVLVGAYRANLGMTSSEAGAGYVFSRSAGTWSQVAKLVPATLAAGDDCGWSVAIEGEHAILSARKRNNSQGSAFHFRNSGSGWSEVQELVSSDGIAGDQFALSVDLDGERTVIGAYLFDGAGGSSGAAYLYDLFRLDLVPNLPIAGQLLTFEVSGATPGAPSWMAVSLVGAGSYPIPPLGIVLDLVSPFQLGPIQNAASDGSVSWPFNVPITASGVTAWAQGLQAGHVTNLRSVTVQ